MIISKVLLPFPANCVQGKLVKRVKRFSVAFTLPEDNYTSIHWAHTNNSGSMLGLLRPGSPVFLSPAHGKKRKLPYTLELIGLPEHQSSINSLPSKCNWVGVNTATPNRILKAAFLEGLLDFAKGYTDFYAEVKLGDSRIDALLTGQNLPPLWIECKNVTLVEDGVAVFPDAVTERGQKHLKEMAAIVQTGAKAAFFYCIQRQDAFCFAPADYVDPKYASLFYEALQVGVASHPYVITADTEGLKLGSSLRTLPKLF